MPGHPKADADGFRTDVLAAMREAGVTQLRWAGNFSSQYHWMDGVGPDRPKKINFAWDAVEDNRHGTAEFIRLCRKVGAEPVIGVNMGSGTAEEAMNWVEYCNGTGDTYYANLRRAHGQEEPFGVKYWCLGNEMYAQWQFGCLTAEEYARKAMQFAFAMRRADPMIRLTAVGLETDPKWNYIVARELLQEPGAFAPASGHYMDYLSAHYYPIGNYSAYTDADYDTRMTLGEFFHERTILMRASMEAAADDNECPAGIVWDEWNPMGVRDGSEFTLEMAMWTSAILNSFIRDSKYVKMANYTFFVGGNGPVQLSGDGLLLHAEYYVFRMYAGLLGTTLIRHWGNIPTVTRTMPVDARWPKNGAKKEKVREIPLIDLAATKNDRGDITLFAVNMSREEEFSVRILVDETADRYCAGEQQMLWNEDVRARNTEEQPKLVTVMRQELRGEGGAFCVKLPAHSIHAIQLKKV